MESEIPPGFPQVPQKLGVARDGGWSAGLFWANRAERLGVLTHMVSPWGAIVEVLAEELVEVDRW